MKELIIFFNNFNIGEIFATICSTFVGAWLAYKWAEKTQQGIEKRAKQEEEQKDRENKIWQLNYLNIFLRMHLLAFIELFQHLDNRNKIIDDILKKQQITQQSVFSVLQPIADFHIDFPLDTSNLLFAADDEHFIQGVSLVKTSLANYYNAIQMLNTNLKPLQLLISTDKLTLEHILVLQQIIRYVLEGVSLAICVFDQMLKDVVDYNGKHDKLSLKPVKNFDTTQQNIILLSHQIRKNCVHKLQKEQYNRDIKDD